MSSPQVLIVPSTVSKAEAQKRRATYIRPFIVFWGTSFLLEAFLFTISVVVFSGVRDIVTKLVWTLVLCPLGMGGAMAGLVNSFITDVYYGQKAVWFVGILAFLVFGTCNDLCFNLDHHYNYFGSVDYPWYFHARYPFIFLGGLSSGRLLFTDEGQEKLARLGV